MTLKQAPCIQELHPSQHIYFVVSPEDIGSVLVIGKVTISTERHDTAIAK